MGAPAPYTETVLPDPAQLEVTVARERALAWTLAMALFGAGWLALGDTPLEAGALVALLAFGVLGWTGAHRETAAQRLSWLAVLGGLFAVPGAMALVDGPGRVVLVAGVAGAAMAILGWSLEGRVARMGRNLEDGDRARAFAAQWLVLVTAAAGLLGLVRDATPLVVASVIVAVLAAARWALARDRLTSRRRWLRDVRAGADLTWTIQPRETFEPRASSLPSLVALRPLDGVLVPRSESGPYRGQAQARVPLVAGTAPWPRWTGLGALRPAFAWVLAFFGPWACAGVFFSGSWYWIHEPLAAVGGTAAGALVLGALAFGLEGTRNTRLVLTCAASLALALAGCWTFYAPWVAL